MFQERNSGASQPSFQHEERAVRVLVHARQWLAQPAALPGGARCADALDGHVLDEERGRHHRVCAG
jgi:hypothetical protein